MVNLIDHTEAYSEPYQTSYNECFTNTFNSFYPWTISTESSILDVWQSFEYTSIVQLYKI